MKISQLPHVVKGEVEKPFQDKLIKSKLLIKLFSKTNCCVSCSFGKDSMAVLFLVLQERSDVPVVFNNTGVEWKETTDFKDKISSQWNLNLIETKPNRSFWEVMEHTKQNHFYQDDGKKHSNICCTSLKHGPFHKAAKTHGFTHTFTGMTALESRHRAFTACERGQEYYSKKDGIWKIHPLLYWTEEEVWNFTQINSIPVNPAYAKYKLNRIGCVPCTSWKNWRAQLARTNPAMYKLIQERYFGQMILTHELLACNNLVEKT